MLKTLLSLLALSCLLSAANAQGRDELCTGLETLIAASPDRFQGLDNAFVLDGVGGGGSVASLSAYSRWESKRTFPTKEAALVEYRETAERIDGCSIDGASLSYTEKTAAELKKQDYVMEGTWKFPAGHAHEKININMHIYKYNGSYLRTFHLSNNDAGNYQRMIASRQDAFGTAKQDNAGPDLCAVLNRVLESGAGFAAVQGALMKSEQGTFPAGLTKTFSSKEKLDGLKAEINTSNTGASWVAESLPGDKADLMPKFNAMKAAISGCTTPIGTFATTGSSETMSIWFPRSLRAGTGLDPEDLSINLQLTPTSKGYVLMLVVRRAD